MVIASHTGSLTRKSKTERKKRYERRSIFFDFCLFDAISLPIHFPCVSKSTAKQFLFLTTLLIKTTSSTPINALDERTVQILNYENDLSLQKEIRKADDYNISASHIYTTCHQQCVVLGRLSRTIYAFFFFAVF